MSDISSQVMILAKGKSKQYPYRTVGCIWASDVVIADRAIAPKVRQNRAEYIAGAETGFNHIVGGGGSG